MNKNKLVLIFRQSFLKVAMKYYENSSNHDKRLIFHNLPLIVFAWSLVMVSGKGHVVLFPVHLTYLMMIFHKLSGSIQHCFIGGMTKRSSRFHYTINSSYLEFWPLLSAARSTPEPLCSFSASQRWRLCDLNKKRTIKSSNISFVVVKLFS